MIKNDPRFLADTSFLLKIMFNEVNIYYERSLFGLSLLSAVAYRRAWLIFESGLTTREYGMDLSQSGSFINRVGR